MIYRNYSTYFNMMFSIYYIVSLPEGRTHNVLHLHPFTSSHSACQNCATWGKNVSCGARHVRHVARENGHCVEPLGWLSGPISSPGISLRARWRLEKHVETKNRKTKDNWNYMNWGYGIDLNSIFQGGHGVWWRVWKCRHLRWNNFTNSLVGFKLLLGNIRVCMRESVSFSKSPQLPQVT